MTRRRGCLIIVAVLGVSSFLCVLLLGIMALGGYDVLAQATPPPEATVPPEADLDNELARALASQPHMTYHASHVTGRTLIVEVTLQRDDAVHFWESLAAIHRAVAISNPAVQEVTIRDSGGQRITVRMEDLRRYWLGAMSAEDFRATWQIVNPQTLL